MSRHIQIKEGSVPPSGAGTEHSMQASQPTAVRHVHSAVSKHADPHHLGMHNRTAAGHVCSCTCSHLLSQGFCRTPTSRNMKARQGTQRKATHIVEAVRCVEGDQWHDK